MTPEERIARLEKAIADQHNTIKKLTSRELALRAFAQAVAQQQNLDLAALYDAYLGLLDEAVAQVPPRFQDRDALEELGKVLADMLSKRNKPAP